MTLTQDEITKRLLQARKLGETPDWATIGKDPDTAGNPFQAQLDTGETNVVYATVVGNPDPQIIYYDPSCDLRLLQYGARVELEWRNGKAWVKGADKEYLTQQQAGTPLPTGNMPLADHDHVTKGGTLGTDSVGTSQITDLAVTTGKINTSAVTLAKMAANSVDSDQYVDGSIDTVHLADDAVIPTKANGLSGASAAMVTQTASDTFSSIDYTFTSNERLLYDGTDIRNAYKYYEVTTNALTTSSTTELAMWTSPDMASVIDTTNSTLLVTAMFTVRETTSAPSSYEFYLKYNYDNGGAEAWVNIDPTRTPVSVTRLHTNTINYDIPVSLSIPFDPSMTGGVGYTAWGYSGTYKLRFSVARDTGTGTLLIFSGNDFTRTFGILEV